LTEQFHYFICILKLSDEDDSEESESESGSEEEEDEEEEEEEGDESDEEEEEEESKTEKGAKKFDRREDSSATTTTAETSQDSEGVVVRKTSPVTRHASTASLDVMIITVTEFRAAKGARYRDTSFGRNTSDRHGVWSTKHDPIFWSTISECVDQISVGQMVFG
jgi:FtsZ-interacting cell division protein YlmF